MSTRTRAIGAGAALVLLGGGVFAAAQSGSPPDNPTITSAASSAAKAKVVFRDDFNGSGLPDSRTWLIDTGTGYEGGPQNGFGTDEIETMTTSLSNIHRSGGKLVITALNKDGKWTSGRTETKDVFKPANGQSMTIESSLKLPDVHGDGAKGAWPAFWTLGNDCRTVSRWDWPACGEIDVTESVNGINKNWSTLHCGYPAKWGGPCGEPSGISNGGVPPKSGDIWGQYHTYKVVWDRTHGTGKDQLRWYVDGVKVHQVNQTDPAVKNVWTTMTHHKGYFVIFDYAMGGQFPAALGGGPNGTGLSGTSMYIDYMQVSLSGSGSTDPAPPTSKPTTAPPTVKPTTPPTTKPPAPKPTATIQPPSGPSSSAYTVHQFEDATDASGMFARSYAGASGGKAVRGNNGDYASWSNLDFGSKPASRVVLRLKTDAPEGVSGTVAVHLDSKDGPLLDAPQNIGHGWNTNWTDLALNAGGVTGKHNLVVTFDSPNMLRTFVVADYLKADH